MGSGVRLAVWERVFSEIFHLLKENYLIPVDGIATKVGCERTLAGHTCAYRVVEHEDGSTVGICDLGYCSKKTFRREELALFALDSRKIARELARVLQLRGEAGQLGAPGVNLRIGTLRSNSLRPVLLCIHSTSCELEYFLTSYFAAHEQQIILILPTERRFSDNAIAILRHQQSDCFILEDHIELTADGIRLSQQGQDVWHDLLLRAGGCVAQSCGLELPDNIQWHDLILRFRDGHTLSVRCGNTTRSFTYAEMGMQDAKSKQPDKQWELLRLFAEERGIFTWRSKGADYRNQKRKERLAKKLKNFFGIKSEPFKSYLGDGGGWEALFTIQTD